LRADSDISHFMLAGRTDIDIIIAVLEGIRMLEMIDIYDENMVMIGTKERIQAHLDGDWHRAFHCWIVFRQNNFDYIVVQRRSPDKDMFPNALDITAAGHYAAGESIEEGVREIKEELGIDLSYRDLVRLGVKIDVAKVGRITNREFNDVFMANFAMDISEYDFQVKELSGLVTFRIDEALGLYRGTKKSVLAREVRTESGPKGFVKKLLDVNVTVDDFVPRVDAYMHKILLLGKRYLNGEKDLVI